MVADYDVLITASSRRRESTLLGTFLYWSEGKERAKSLHRFHKTAL